MNVTDVNYSEGVFSTQLVSKVNATGGYEKEQLPFGYKGSVSLGSEFFGEGEVVKSVRFHFTVPRAVQANGTSSFTESTLVSLGDGVSGVKLTVKRTYGVIRVLGSPAEVVFTMMPDRLYDFVLTEGDGRLTVYINGRRVGELVGSLEGVTSGELNVNTTTVTPSTVYMFVSWSRTLSAGEVSMMYSLDRPAVGGVDYMEGVRVGLISEFLPVNIKGGLWWNTGVKKRQKGVLYDISVGSTSFVQLRSFIVSEGVWEAAGRFEDSGSSEFVKVKFYNYSFFGSQVCYVGLEGFSGVPEGLEALNASLVFTTRPILSSQVSVTSTTEVVVDVSEGQTWQPPTGVQLVLTGDLVSAGGVVGDSITKYVKIDESGASGWKQTYLTDTGVSREVSFTLEDMTNLSYSFTPAGGNRAESTVTVASRMDIEGVIVEVGTVWLSYYVHGVQGFTEAVVLSQQENVRSVGGTSTMLELSTQSLSGQGGLVYYVASYGEEYVWTSGLRRTELLPCGVSVKEDWVSRSSAVSGEWQGSLLFAPFVGPVGQRVATVSAVVPEGYPPKSLTVTQEAYGMGVNIMVQVTDNTFRDLMDMERYVWFIGSIEWAGERYTFNEGASKPTLVRIKDLVKDSVYVLGTIYLPQGTVWSNITCTVQCGSVVSESPGGDPTEGRGDGKYCSMKVQPLGFNLDAPVVYTYSAAASVLSSTPWGYYPTAVGSPTIFRAGGNSMRVSTAGGAFVFEVSQLEIVTLQS